MFLPVQRELEQAKSDEAAIEDYSCRKTHGLTTTKEKLDGIKDTHDRQMMVQRSY